MSQSPRHLARIMPPRRIVTDVRISRLVQVSAAAAVLGEVRRLPFAPLVAQVREADCGLSDSDRFSVCYLRRLDR